MKFDWDSYRKRLAERIEVLGKQSPLAVDRYRELAQAGEKAKLLGLKNRELVALAVSLALLCDGCVAEHAESALKYGASPEEIVEVIDTALAVHASASVAYSSQALDVVWDQSSV